MADCAKKIKGSCRECSDYRYDSEEKRFRCMSYQVPNVKDWVVTVVRKYDDDFSASTEIFRVQATGTDLKKIMEVIVNDHVENTKLSISETYGDNYSFSDRDKDIYYSFVRLTDEDAEADAYIEISAENIYCLDVKTVKDFIGETR